MSQKREVFTWKKEHDVLLAREMLVEVPHRFKAGTKERGKKWDDIASNLGKAGLKVTKRLVRERFEKLSTEFKQRESNEKLASGINCEYDELHKAMTDLSQKINDYEGEYNENKNKEKLQAEDMRKKAAEKLGETKKRYADEEEEEIPKRRRSVSVAEIMEQNMARKSKESDDQMQIRERELDLRAEELQQQQQFQAMILQQMQQQQQQEQQQQQQQQAMNMAFMNALGELMKKF